MPKVQRFIKKIIKKIKTKGKTRHCRGGREREKKGRNQQYVYNSRPEENGNGAQSFAELLDAVSHTFSLPWPSRPFFS